MYFCVCKAITEEKLRDTVTTRMCDTVEACKSLGAGTDCGMCMADIQKLSQKIEKSSSTTHTKNKVRTTKK